MIRIPALKQPATHGIIFLHGLGDSGQGWSFFAQQMQALSPKSFQSTTWIFPTAPQIPITANGLYPMNAWFDLMEWDPEMKQFDSAGYAKTLKHEVREYIDNLINKEGIPPSNIILGGFSQGAAVALGAAIDLPWKLGGFISLSGFISCDKSLFPNGEQSKNLQTPIFHGHGDCDPVVALSRGRASIDWMVKTYGFQSTEFREYHGLQHSADMQELADLCAFIKKSWGV